MTRKALIICSAIMAIAVFSISGFWYEYTQNKNKTNAPAVSNAALNRAGAPVYGADSAKVTIVEFFDPACETCRAFYAPVKKLVDESDGRLKLIIRYAPFHEGSSQAVKILEAARMQGEYWPTLETILQMQPQWASHSAPDVELIWNFLRISGLDLDQARRDMESPDIQAMLAQDMADLKTLQITQTPTFFVNGKPLQTFGLEPLNNLIEQETSAAYRP